jgi:2'-5' RNA ligase
MTRTFLALDLGQELRTFLAEAIQAGARLLPIARWVDPASLHLTLAFLGELDAQELHRACAAAAASASQVRPFSYHLTRPGIFGSPRAPRVIWMGVEESSGRLRDLQRSLLHELEYRGFPPEERPFSPHLTLARLKSPLRSEEQEALQRFLRQWAAPARLSGQRVDELYVMKSELTRSGPRYTPLHRAALASS